MSTRRCQACGAELLFAVSGKTGSTMPLNAKAVTMFRLEPDAKNPAVTVAVAVQVHESHFATCSDPKRFRKAG